MKALTLVKTSFVLPFALTMGITAAQAQDSTASAGATSDAPLATAMLNDGWGEARVAGVERDGDKLTVRVRFYKADGADGSKIIYSTLSTAIWEQELYLVVGDKKYLLLRDSDGSSLATRSLSLDADDLQAGAWYGVFPAPPAGEQAVLHMPQMEPLGPFPIPHSLKREVIMFRPESGLAVFVAVGVALMATGISAQGQNAAPAVLPLEATILDLEATVQDMGGSVQDISAEAKETLERSGNIAVRSQGDEVILSVTSDILFAFDSADLSADAKGSLTDIAAIIARAPEGQVRVVGHTDAKGSDDYNMELSQRRAKAVTEFLEGADISAERLTTEGRGEAEPLAENEVNGEDNPEGRAKNRRVEFVMPKIMLQE